MRSVYLQNLLRESREVGERYLLKIKVIGDVDPFVLKDEELDFSIEGVPPITNMDIVSYLVLTHSYYSKEQMKAFKSLQAYKFFEAGFVIKVGSKLVKDIYILVGKVRHSQRANLKPLDVWSIIALGGSICTAHCTCMAGNSEVCSHVGAILFAAEYANRIREATSCTDMKSTWPRPSLTNVPIVPASDMDFGKTSIQERKQIPPMSVTEIGNMLTKIEELGSSSALMRIVEPFASKISASTSKPLPSVMELFNDDYLSKDYPELMAISKSINITLKPEDFTVIEEATRSQNENPNWFKQRAGRITASNFKAVCRTNKNCPSLSLIKSICYPTRNIFITKAISWGISHEHIAVEEYKRCMEEENHEDFIVNEVGLVVSKQWHQLGASPDRIVFCECHKGGCLEIKCPYLLHQNNVDNINDYVNMKNSCLIEENGRITLNKSHSYYFQVQMQIHVTQLLYCDFVIWSPRIFFKERILPDDEFFLKNCDIALKFHSEVILPELLGRYFTRKEGTARVTYWCICHGVDDGSPMLKCDGDECENQWFHFRCVGLKDTPNELWYCDNCRD